MKLKKIIAVSLTLTAMLSIVPIAGAQSSNWGLSYPNLGHTPVGNASREMLLENDAYFAGNPEEKVIYLTFDAGYENGYMEKILDTLKEKEVPAAFFLVGTYIRDYPELTARMAADGHIVANHTMSHPNMSAISDKTAFEKELSRAEEIYKKLTGQDMPKYYRPPEGVYSDSNLKMAKELGYKTVFWSLAYVDWQRDKQPSHEEAFSKLLRRVHPGAVILLHSTSRTNAEILGDLIDKYRDMGYAFQSLDDLTNG